MPVRIAPLKSDKPEENCSVGTGVSSHGAAPSSMHSRGFAMLSWPSSVCQLHGEDAHVAAHENIASCSIPLFAEVPVR